MQKNTSTSPSIPERPAHYQSPRPQRSMSTERAGELLDTSSRQVRRLIAAGELRAFRLGRVLRVTEEAVAEFQQSQAV